MLHNLRNVQYLSKSFTYAKYQVFVKDVLNNFVLLQEISSET